MTSPSGQVEDDVRTDEPFLHVFSEMDHTLRASSVGNVHGIGRVWLKDTSPSSFFVDVAMKHPTRERLIATFLKSDQKFVISAMLAFMVLIEMTVKRRMRDQHIGNSCIPRVKKLLNHVRHRERLQFSVPFTLKVGRVGEALEGNSLERLWQHGIEAGSFHADGAKEGFGCGEKVVIARTEKEGPSIDPSSKVGTVTCDPLFLERLFDGYVATRQVGKEVA